MGTLSTLALMERSTLATGRELQVRKDGNGKKDMIVPQRSSETYLPKDKDSLRFMSTYDKVCEKKSARSQRKCNVACPLSVSVETEENKQHTLVTVVVHVDAALQRKPKGREGSQVGNPGHHFVGCDDL